MAFSCTAQRNGNWIWGNESKIFHDKCWLTYLFSCQDVCLNFVGSKDPGWGESAGQAAKLCWHLATESRGSLPITAKSNSCMLSHAGVSHSFVTLCTVAHQALLSTELSRQEYWNGLPFPPPRDLPNPGMEPASLVSPALAGGFFTTSVACTINITFHYVAVRIEWANI